MVVAYDESSFQSPCLCCDRMSFCRPPFEKKIRLAAARFAPDRFRGGEILGRHSNQGPKPIIVEEVDWIYGGLSDEKTTKISVIIAPVSLADAKHDGPQRGGSIVDLTLNNPSNDQLSWYTLLGRTLFVS